MRIVIALIWLVIVSVAFGQAPIQRNTFTTNSNPRFRANSNVLITNINSSITYEFFGDPASNSNRVMRSGDITSGTTINNVLTNLSLTARRNYWVDQVNGSDSNGGTNAAAAFKTINGLSNAVSGNFNNLAIHLARGSIWREQLTLGSNNVVQAFGSGPRPILTAADHATNSLWQKVSGFVNLWAISNWCIISTPPTYISVAENGIQLIRSNTLAGADSVPGTFFAIDDPAAGFCTNIVYIHPRGSTIPTNDFKLYEIGARLYGLFGGHDNTVEDVHTSGPQLSNNGSFELGRRGLVRRCLFENGTKHNAFLQSGVMEDTVGWKQEYNSTASVFVHFQPTVEELDVAYFRCKVLEAPKAEAWFGHSGGDGYRQVIFEDCSGENVQSLLSPGISGRGLAILRRVRGVGVSLSGISLFGGTNILVDCEFLDLPEVSKSPSFSDVGITSGGTGLVWIAGCVFPNKVRMTMSTNHHVEIHQSYIGKIETSTATFANTNCIFVSSNNILVGFPPYDLHPGNTLVAAGSNCFPGGIQFRVNGIQYLSFGDYRAAWPALDIGSVTNDLQTVGTATQGNYQYSRTSPAVTNTAGQGWGISRRPVIGLLDQSLFVPEYPPSFGRQVGGRWLDNEFLQATNELWRFKLNRTNDTAQILTVQGGFTNLLANNEPMRVSSAGNLVVNFNKAAAGNTLDINLQAAGTKYGGINVGPGGTLTFSADNANILALQAVNNFLQFVGGGGGVDTYRVFTGGTLRERMDVNGNWFLAQAATITNTLTVKSAATFEATISAKTNIASFDIIITDFTINTWYTNDNRRASVVVAFELDSNTTGTAKAGLYIDQAVDGTFETTITTQIIGLAEPVQHVVTGWLQPNARFAITNLSSGSGSPTVAVVAGSSQWVKQ